MPYIKQEQRKELEDFVTLLGQKLLENGPDNMGEYNYVITKLIHDYIYFNGLKYSNLNNIVGMLECAKAEFIRKVVSPYEEKKIKENGSVSQLDRE